MWEYEVEEITSVEELHMLLGNVVEVRDGSDIRCEMYQNVWLRRMGDNILSDGAILYRCYSDGFQGVIGINSYKSLEEFPADFSKIRIDEAVLQGFSLQGSTFKNIKPYTFSKVRFENLDMRRATFEYLTFGSRSLFKNCNLDSSRWMGVDLEDAVVRSSSFENAEFSKCDLSFMPMDNVNLKGARFSSVKFDYPSYITNTDLTDTIFENCEFGDQLFIDYRDRRLSRLGFKYLGKGSRNKQANLEDIPFNGADLSSSDFREAEIARCDFSSCDLTDVNFGKVEISGCTFKDANLTNVKLGSARIYGCKFDNANLTNVNLGKADLSGNTFENTDLRGSNFQSSELHKVNFRNADLRGANLRTEDFAYLSKDSLQGAKYDDATKLPKGFNPENYGMVYVEDPNNTPSEHVEDVEEFFFSSY